MTTTFGYTDDRPTTFGGSTIAYNAMGCPTTYDGKTATWTKGKLSRLFSGTLAAGSNSYNFVYNAYGQRVSRSYTYMEGTSGSNPVQVGQLTAYTRSYNYDHAGRLIAETINKTIHGEGTSNENIVFLYDESGIIGMELTTGGVTSSYYFQRNLQGDVVAIYDANGVLKAKYLYDAWGNCTISSETTSYDVANANPIRYRGYYYDDDTGLYYCNARYYSPKWRRFISPDDTTYLDPESVNGLNLYCYCNNDPVNYADPSGHMPNWAKWLIGGIAFATAVTLTALTGGALAPMFIQMGASIVLGGLIQGTINASQGESFWNGFVDGAANGALSGGLLAFGQSIFRIVKVAHYASNGLTIGKTGTFEQIGHMTRTSHYGGLKSYRMLSKLFGKNFASKVGWIQNKSIVQGVMKFKGVIFDCGGELTGAYAKEVALTKGYEYLVNIWLL